MTRITPFLLLCLSAPAFSADAAWQQLERAYAALRESHYDKAVTEFRAAVTAAPERASIRKDLAYALLKLGENDQARDSFAEAIRLDPADKQVALEYAFLCFETHKEAEARRVFSALARSGNATAKAAFERIDQELATGIERWQKAVELTPDSFSAHEELARLAERRDEFALATTHYAAAWKLRPTERKYLLDLGRVAKQSGEGERATAALLAASRGAESRTAELARALLPDRYPWVNEFRAALTLDPANHALHRELAFLLLEMNRGKEAAVEFRQVIQTDPKDAWALAQLGFLLLQNEPAEALPLLDRSLAAGGDDEELKDRVRTALKLPQELKKRPTARRDALLEARLLAQKSLDAGYLKDAARYLRIAHEHDPLDFNVLLKLGWTHNLLREDKEAMEWFRLARRSPDPVIAAEAGKAYSSLQPEFARFRTSVWAYPMYSSRWQDLFTWAQAKTEWHPAGKIVPYISMRFAGDVRRTTNSLGTPGLGTQGPAYLSESAFLPGVGVGTRVKYGMRAWFEAGYSFSYLKQGDAPRGRPDLRGGLSFARSIGTNLASPGRGIFAETAADLLYVSRFDKDTILYALNRAGYTLGAIGPAKIQATWNLNITADLRRFAWANTIEQGPGVRIKLTCFPQPIIISVDALQGRYTVLDGIRPPVYNDLRIGLWYAFSR
ncbi:MAG: tetratricopeptide repeat protein [Bryobacteraceae bacterium]|nr:tetratricopeptide repeat protein [Bryobacteraceae bacterium]